MYQNCLLNNLFSYWFWNDTAIINYILSHLFLFLGSPSPLTCLSIPMSVLYFLSSVAQSFPTLRDPSDCSTPGFPVHHHLPELAQTPFHRSRWCQPTITFSVVPFSSSLQSFPASRSFPVSQFFASSGKSIAVSASTSVLPMNIQDWFPLEWTGWISL